jgi:hypothetical protein
MTDPTDVFDAIHRSAETVLRGHGFHVSEARTYPQAFGSRSVVYSRGQSLVRLTWDGKERWFVFEASPRSDDAGRPAWFDLAVQRWEPTTPFDAYRDEVVGGLLRSLSGYLASDLAR